MSERGSKIEIEEKKLLLLFVLSVMRKSLLYQGPSKSRAWNQICSSIETIIFITKKKLETEREKNIV